MNEARENEVESTTCPNCGESILPGQLPCDRKAAPTEPAGIRLPVEGEIKLPAWYNGSDAIIYDADTAAIAATDMCGDDPESVWHARGEQIVTALNEYDRLKAENQNIRAAAIQIVVGIVEFLDELETLGAMSAPVQVKFNGLKEQLSAFQAIQDKG